MVTWIRRRGWLPLLALILQIELHLRVRLRGGDCINVWNALARLNTVFRCRIVRQRIQVALKHKVGLF